MKSKQDTNYLIFIGILALVFRIYGISYGLPFLYNIDEAGLIRAAVRFSSGDFNTHGVGYQPLLAYLFFGIYIIYYAFGRVWGIFSSLADFKALYFTDWSVFYVIGRLNLALMGVITVIVVYLLGKKAYNRTTGIVASLFLTFSALHLDYSRIAKPDCGMTLFVVLAIYFIHEIIQNGSSKNYILAGIFSGLAITTKYNAVFLVLPILAVHFMNLWENKKLSIKTLNLKPLILCYMLMVVAFLFGNPFFLIDFDAFFRDIRYTSFVLSDQGNIFKGLMAYIKAVFFPYTYSDIGDYVGILSLVGVVYAIYKRTRTDLLILIFPMFLLLYTSYKTAHLIQVRYILPVIPFFYILGARFISDSIDKLKITNRKKSLVLYLTVIILLFHPVRYAVKMCYAESQTDTATLARKWIEENIPVNSRILYTERFNLMLKENKESLIENYHIRETYLKKYAKFTREFPQAKIDAIENYPGVKYYIAHFPEGGDKLTSKRAEEFGQLPPGFYRMDIEKILLDYWISRNIEYVIVFPSMLKKYFTNAGQKEYPEHYCFYSQLFKRGQLLKQWTPNYPHRPGIEIQLYKISVK